ncbi:multiple sugar transport system substrate-binding protein [Inquilinus ginsengisoli]|uniref:Multiple sugar transport system substrate-binding protein n=1 Tax=Inquilinus ginsengisoli TaxID=363840 RepID=A0ABU1JIF5_9PROT|nr:extracellular solute-binding protein [Inquilinus ginsengisoli]MDR6288392.1 multiple sugar transport system substrate-binding protein [Inquilinus ginsengisoli]
MTINLTRRGLLASTMAGAATMALGRAALGQTRTLNALSHLVHQNVLTKGSAGDVIAPWCKAAGAEITWTTLDSNPLQDRLFREASLGRTTFNVGFVVDNRMTPQIAGLFEPLDGYQASDPIEDIDDIAPGLRRAMTVGGKTVGIPVRHATQALFYNEALLEEAGIAAPPTTVEELVEQAKKLTFTSAAGTPVTGMILASDLAVFPVMFARAFGGDFIGADFRVVPNREAMEKGLSVLADLFQARALPRSYANTRNDDMVTWLQQGRAAFGVLPFARFAQLNNPEQSSVPGKIKAVEFPGSATLPAGSTMAAVVESWAMVIPANSADKDLSWSFIKAVSSKAVTLGAARNGNGPVRVSTYADADFAAAQPLARIESAALAKARPAFPAFPEAVRAQATFLEEVQLAVLGRKTPQEAVAAIVERVTPLMPA